MRNKKSFLTLGIIVLVLFLGVGYAVVSSVYLNIGGTANVADTELKVEITNVEAETNMTDKILDFSNVLSNNNLTSNFTLKNMSLNELVTITYTVTNNEKDVDAFISAIDGVDLSNSNPDCFDVNYQITDNETDLENGDKTMEVVVTVELIKTPLNDDESTTNVGLTLAAIPKGVDPSTIKPPSGISDVLDNAWPVTWNTLEVVNNSSVSDGNVVRVSNLTPSLTELQSMNLVLMSEGDSAKLSFIDGDEIDSACIALYSIEDSENVYVYSVSAAGDYWISDTEKVTVTEPGLYFINVGLKDIDIDISLEPQMTTPYFEEKYLNISFWGVDVRNVDAYSKFYEDGHIIEKTALGSLVSDDGYVYNENEFMKAGSDGSNKFTVSSNGVYVTYYDMNNVFSTYILESEYDRIKNVPVRFGIDYVCTVDNEDSGAAVGNTIIFYPDGSASSNGEYTPAESFMYKDNYIYPSNMPVMPEGTNLEVSDDGVNITLSINGQTVYVFTVQTVVEDFLPLSWNTIDVSNNTSVVINDSSVSDKLLRFIKLDFDKNYPVLYLAGADVFINGKKSDMDYTSYTIGSNTSVFYADLVKFSNGTDDLYVLSIITPGDYYGVTFEEPGLYVLDMSGENKDIDKDITITYSKYDE